MANVTIIHVLSDNYAYLLSFSDGTQAVIDPGEAGPVIDALDAKGLRLDYILNTHHHGDHVAGNAELKNKYNAKLIAPEKDLNKIKDIDIPVRESGELSVGGEKIQVIETPGHTLGGVIYYIPESGVAFTGDTLFVMGCGRLFEGTPEQMWRSLNKITALPDETKLYVGHEYTLANAEFCLTVEPENTDLRERVKILREWRKNGQPTVPTTVEMEKRTNAFVRADSAEQFAEIREQKDRG